MTLQSNENRSMPEVEAGTLAGPNGPIADTTGPKSVKDGAEGSTTQDPASSAKGWLVVLSASAVLFIAVGYTNAFGVFQDYYQSTLFPNEPVEKLIVIGSIASSLYFVLGAFTGRFADYVGYRVALVLGSALMIGAMFAASVSRQYWQFLLSQGIMFGLGSAFAYAPATAVSRQYFGKGRHGVASAVVVSGGALGGCVLPYSIEVALSRHGLPWTFRLLGYLAVGVLVPSIVLLQPRKPAKLTGVAQRQPIMDLTLLANPRFLGLLVACTIAMFGFLPRYFLLPVSARSQGITPTYSSWLLGMMNGLSIIGRVGIGYVADHYGQVNALAASFMLCGLGQFIFWIPAVTISSQESGAITALFSIFVVFVGLFGSGFISLFPVVVSQLFGSEALASKTGLLNTAIGLSTMAGPSAVYAMIEHGQTPIWWLGIFVAGLFMVVGGVFLGVMTRIWQKREYDEAG